MWHGRAPHHRGWGRGTPLGGKALPSCTTRELLLLPAPLQPAPSPDVTAQSHPDSILLQLN